MNINLTITPNKTVLPNCLYRGFGMVSANNSSRLLIDYKYEHPDRYNELLRLMFTEEGLNICHLKIELGADINSSSGTEPCTMRHKDEHPVVRRGANFQLAADAKKVNPDITLDMLYWSEPRWVTDSGSESLRYEARYKWFKDTLNSAYETYGLKFDYISPNRNERTIEPEWIKYCAKKLKSETDCLYDFSAIKIVAADEEGSWRIADLMLNDEELLNAVDIVASHYTSHGTENTRRLSEEYQKEIWFSEGCPPMKYAQGASNFEESGLGGINGVLDIANRIIAMYPCGSMTMYEFQPVIAAYYDGVTYGYKHLLIANEPWSGFYKADSGFYMALHFSKLIRKGWEFADSACFCDGEKSSDGHALINTRKSCLAAYDRETGDYSVVICNSTDEEQIYKINVHSLKKSDHLLNVYETSGNSYFKTADSITPEKIEDGCRFEIKIAPFSLVTVSTLAAEKSNVPSVRSAVLSLPYIDDYNYPQTRLLETAGAPKYTTDQGGAFEIVKKDGKNVLMQMITAETKAEEWGETPLPTTSFGDDRWYNYSVSVNVQLDQSDDPDGNFAGVGLRYNSACKGVSGYSLLLYQNGKLVARQNDQVRRFGGVDFDTKKPHNLKLNACYNKVECFVDGILLSRYSATDMCLSAGRAAFYSAYQQNVFFDFKAEPITPYPYVKRFDDSDPEFTYYGKWEHNTMSGFSDYKRTVSRGKAGSGLKFTFKGTGFAFFSENKDYSFAMLLLDGKKIENLQAPPDDMKSHIAKQTTSCEVREMNRQVFENIGMIPTERREHIFWMCGLPDTEHTVEIVILRGELTIDGAEVFSADLNP